MEARDRQAETEERRLDAEEHLINARVLRAEASRAGQDPAGIRLDRGRSGGGEQLRSMVKASLEQAREAIRNLPSLNETARAKALAAIDRAQAHADRDLERASRS